MFRKDEAPVEPVRLGFEFIPSALSNLKSGEASCLARTLTRNNRKLEAYATFLGPKLQS